MPFIIIRKKPAEELKQFIESYALSYLTAPDKIKVSTSNRLYIPPYHIPESAEPIDYVQAHCYYTKALKNCVAIQVPKRIDSDDWLIEAQGTDYAGYINDEDFQAIQAQIEIYVRLEQVLSASDAVKRSVGISISRRNFKGICAPDVDEIQDYINEKIKALKATTDGFSDYIRRNSALFEFT